MEKLDWLSDFRKIRISNTRFRSRATDDGELFAPEEALALRLDYELAWKIQQDCADDGLAGDSGYREYSDRLGELSKESQALEEEIRKLSDNVWGYDADNVFAQRYLDRLKELQLLPLEAMPLFLGGSTDGPAYDSVPLALPPHNQRLVLESPEERLGLCQRCISLNISSAAFELLVNAADLPKMAVESCQLCRTLSQLFEAAGERLQGQVRIYRQGSSLKLDGQDRPIFRICADPAARGVPDDIQWGFPILAEPGSPKHIVLLLEWLKVCDQEHACCSDSDSPLPTRIIDVGGGSQPNVLRLHCTKSSDRGRYLALSHRWGAPTQEDTDKVCTHLCNVGQRRERMEWSDLPRTYQDAVTLARQLDIRYLWIDSICILQPHKGCSSTCDSLDDWDVESGLMERYYSSAYCTIAATSAGDSTTGFLGPRPASTWIRVRDASGTPLYLCSAIDDFHSHVEEGLLNQRAWVLQERALSRRTIHFAATQTYWECGHGIRCETLTRTSNSRASFLGDSQFPDYLLGYDKSNRFRLAEVLFELYSKLAITEPTDRPVAISGLEKRLAKSLETEAVHGVFRSCFHRSLLWQRSGDASMSRIAYPERRKVPSWSWMAYEGGIRYMDIPLSEMEWNIEIQLAPTNVLQQPQKGNGRLGHVSGIEIRAQGRSLSLNEEAMQHLVFDTSDILDVQRLRCVVVGRKHWSSKKQKYYVLLVGSLSDRENTYERVGVGVVDKGHMVEGSEIGMLVV